MKKIFIRLGHDILKNGYCTGSEGLLKEYEVVREYGKSLAEALETQFEVKVFDSKCGTFQTSSIALSAGVKEANDWGADLFISCHANKYNGKARGCEVCCYFKDTRTTYLAKDISKRISDKLNIPNRGVKDRLDLKEIRDTAMGALIIEPFFIDNYEDCNRYKEVGYLNLARAICESVELYL